MKRILLCILFTVLSFAYVFGGKKVTATIWDEVKDDTARYICGEGWGETVDEADHQALAAIISKISVEVYSNYEQLEGEKTIGGEQEYKRYVENKVSTFSSATLTNTESIILSNEPDAHVARWIKRSELNKIFEGRKAKIREYLDNAMSAEKKGKVDDALRNLYWAYSLLKTLQHPSDELYVDSNGQSHVLASWIPNVMDDIFDELQVSVVGRDGDDLELYFEYKGSPVTSLDYTYFDGSRWSNIYSAKDGKGILELAPGAPGENIQIKYEYAYRNEAHIEKDLYSVINVVKGNSMKSSYAYLKSKVDKATAKQVAKEDKASVKETTASLQTVNDSNIRTMMKKIGEAIKSKNYSSVDDLFTAEGLDMWHRLVAYGNASLLGTQTYSVYKNGNRTQVRALPMSFSFTKGLRKSFVEDVVFTFDENDKIESLSFALDDKAATDILNKTAWPENARMSIIEFLENYKTAFALERLDYIRTIFDDNAVIIVGKVARVSSTSATDAVCLPTVENNLVVTRTRYSKEQYIKQLARCFASNEFVNIRFANNEVIKAGKGGEVYGIQIKQDYYSTSYGDSGYLFLMVDINNPKEPMIKVRTWQSEPDPIMGLFDLSCF